MVYALGAVKPWVAAAAEALGAAFKLSDIGGYRSKGSVPNSDHPKGLALDLMIGNDKAKGQAIANYARQNAAPLGVTYVIWNRRIWSRDRNDEGWRTYTGPSPHTDHVHLSFQGSSPGGGAASAALPFPDIPGVPDPTDIAEAAADIAKSVRGIASAAADSAKLSQQIMKLFLPTNLLRAGAGILGAVLVLVGIITLVREAR